MVGFDISSRVLVVGLGRSGLAAARLAVADGAEVWVTDLRSESELSGVAAQLPDGVHTFFGGHPDACLDGVEMVVASPGVPARAPLIERAWSCGMPVFTEVEFAWFHRPAAPLAAVTGSNGKSTVTELVAHMLREAGQEAAAGGNLGTAASELVLEDGWESWVLEISSFQAELLTAMKPKVAVLLNLSQDHLERHIDLDGYLEAKRRLFAFQGVDDVAVLNADDPAVASTPTAALPRMFSISGPADACLDGDRLLLDGELLLRANEMRLSGAHNLANALAATLSATALGASPGAVASALRVFDGLAHRHRTVHIKDGVRWVDDSKATNVGATLAALQGYPNGSVHLILGGQAKGQDFSVVLAEVRRAVDRLYLIGEDGPAIGEALGTAAPAEKCRTLDEAVARARRSAAPGQTVLLAPACASLDQFSDYGERGDCFADLAREGVASCP